MVNFYWAQCIFEWIFPNVFNKMQILHWLMWLPGCPHLEHCGPSLLNSKQLLVSSFFVKNSFDFKWGIMGLWSWKQFKGQKVMLKQGKSCYLMMIFSFFFLFIKLFSPPGILKTGFFHTSVLCRLLCTLLDTCLVVWEDGKRCLPSALCDEESKDEGSLHGLG